MLWCGPCCRSTSSRRMVAFPNDRVPFFCGSFFSPARRRQHLWQGRTARVGQPSPSALRPFGPQLQGTCVSTCESSIDDHHNILFAKKKKKTSILRFFLANLGTQFHISVLTSAGGRMVPSFVLSSTPSSPISSTSRPWTR